MKKDFSKIICNEHQKEIFSLQLREDKLSHAYILVGAKGTGKHTFARLIAAAIECEHRFDEDISIPCESCPSCEKILADGAVDVTYVKREEDRTSLTVGVIRDMQNDIFISSTEQKNKIYIIEEAHLMNEQAQNAFLKSLEEPPKNVVFILLSENNELLLETIKSRAQTFHMDLIAHDIMEKYLKENSAKARSLAESSPEALSEIIVSAQGSIGTALSFLDARTQKQLLSRRALVKEFLLVCRAKNKKTATIAFFSPLSQKKREDLIEFFSLSSLALRDVAACKKSNEITTCFFGTAEEAKAIAQDISPAGIFLISDALESAKDALTSNANITITIANLICELQKKQY